MKRQNDKERYEIHIYKKDDKEPSESYSESVRKKASRYAKGRFQHEDVVKIQVWDTIVPIWLKVYELSKIDPGAPAKPAIDLKTRERLKDWYQLRDK